MLRLLPTLYLLSVSGLPPAAAPGPELVTPAAAAPEPAATPPGTPAAGEPVPAVDGDDELSELQAAEAALLAGRGAGLSARELRQLGAGNPYRLLLQGPLGADADAAWEPQLDAALPAGALPFPIDAVAAKYDIPVDYNQSVASYLAFFQGPGRKWFSRWLSRGALYVPGFRAILREHGVPEDLVYLAMIESGFSPTATSWARAAGQWQFIEPTGRMFGLRTDFWVDERRDPVKSTHAAARFLKQLHGNFGDWYLAWAAYNAGPGRVRKAIASEGSRDFWELAETRAFRPETRGYVPKLIAAALIAKHPEQFGFEAEAERELPPFDVVELSDAADLAVISRCAGVPVEAVKALNPELRRWATPPKLKGGKPYRLKLPAGTAPLFAEKFAQVKPSERFTFRAHKVQRGDTLGHIALAFGTDVEAIMRVNGLTDVRKLRLGQELIVPLPPGVAQSVDAGERPRRSVEPRKQPATAALSSSSAPAPTPRAEPPAGFHDLGEGETLGHVAIRYHCSVEELRRWNSIRNVKKLQVGQRLRVRAD